MLEALSATEREYLLRLGAALLCGMVLGAGREIRGKRAGLRTHALMAFSAALVTVTGLHLMTSHGPPNAGEVLRILQALAQALGFLAAGAIIRAGDVPQGLTTAVNLWLAGAIGISCGSGMYLIAGVATLVTLVILEALPIVERAAPTHHPRDRSNGGS